MENIRHPYCRLALDHESDHPHRIYHDQEYGFPIESDDELFGRLILEINQAGLSWLTILKKKDNFKKAYSDYKLKEVASYGKADIDRLLNDAGIIRNKLKIDAAIYNAASILDLQKKYGSFANFLDQHIGLELNGWVKLFKKHFKFTGGEICNEFLMSSSYLAGAHDENCPVHQRIKRLEPKWLA
jgi:DNA-3-methyladenine glycosylase I